MTGTEGKAALAACAALVSSSISCVSSNMYTDVSLSPNPAAVATRREALTMSNHWCTKPSNERCADEFIHGSMCARFHQLVPVRSRIRRSAAGSDRLGQPSVWPPGTFVLESKGGGLSSMAPEVCGL